MAAVDHHVTGAPHEPNHADILRQLDSITSSSLFSKSKRYPNFLRYIVEHTLAGRTYLLKERTLGIEVFHRASDYDTNADPVVRITAGEIRKRLAQYYGIPGREHELRFDLPIGSYTPLFSRSAYEASPPSPVPFSPSTDTGSLDAAARTVELSGALELSAVEPGPSALGAAAPGAEMGRAVQRRALRLTLATLSVAAALLGMMYALGMAWTRAHTRGIAAFWSPVFHAENPALIVLGVHSFGPDGKDHMSTTLADGGKQSMLSAMTSTNMLPVSDVASYSQITDLLVHHDHHYHTQSAAETTFSQLQPGPIILLGGLDNAWTLRLTAPLRFHFSGQEYADGVIEDTQHRETQWRFNNAQSSHSNSRDYALVASFFDPGIEQRVLVAAGIGMSGTAAAASFLTSNHYLQGWVSHAQPARGANVELVISTEIVDGQQGPPRVVAAYTW